MLDYPEMKECKAKYDAIALEVQKQVAQEREEEKAKDGAGGLRRAPKPDAKKPTAKGTSSKPRSSRMCVVQ